MQNTSEEQALTLDPSDFSAYLKKQLSALKDTSEKFPAKERWESIPEECCISECGFLFSYCLEKTFGTVQAVLSISSHDRKPFKPSILFDEIISSVFGPYTMMVSRHYPNRGPTIQYSYEREASV